MKTLCDVSEKRYFKKRFGAVYEQKCQKVLFRHWDDFFFRVFQKRLLVGNTFNCFEYEEITIQILDVHVQYITNNVSPVPTDMHDDTYKLVTVMHYLYVKM